MAVAHQHVHEDPPWPSQVKPDIPPELDSVVLKAMSKNPANRYQSAADLRADLIKVLAGGKPSAPMLLSDEDRTEFMGSFLDTGPRRLLAEASSRRSGGAGGGNHRRDEDGDDDELRRRPSRKLVFGSIAAVLVLLGALLVFWAPWSSDDSAKQVAVPAVAGKPADTARNSLQGAGFRVKQLEEPSLDVPPGNATRSTPGSNVLAAQGSEVTLYISDGPQRHQMPDLRGRTAQDATEALRVMGFLNVKTDQVDSTAELKDKVVNTTPPTGTDAPVNGAVVVHIGSGPKEVTVPDVTGQTEAEARTVLRQIGLEMVSVAGDSELPAGQIVSSSPGRGVTVEQGSTVQVTVSRGNMFTVPNLRGQTPAQAQDALAAAGWSATTLTRTTRNVPLGSPDDGKVISQDPPAGSSARKNESISIVVAQVSLLPN